jgi:hypothetical protein
MLKVTSSNVTESSTCTKSTSDPNRIVHGARHLHRFEILGALVWRFLMLECAKEKSRHWEAEALENKGGTPFHSG